jgi:hypothetical protein
MPMRGDLPVPAVRLNNRAATSERKRSLPNSSEQTVVLAFCVIGLSVTLIMLKLFPDFAAMSALLDQFP